MAKKITKEFKELMASWFKRVSELHQHALDTSFDGMEIINNGEFSDVVALVAEMDGILDGLIATGDAYSQKLAELVAEQSGQSFSAVAAIADELEYPVLDDSLPPLVKKDKRPN